jgi:hypothetical protein
VASLPLNAVELDNYKRTTKFMKMQIRNIATLINTIGQLNNRKRAKQIVYPCEFLLSSSDKETEISET